MSNMETSTYVSDAADVDDTGGASPDEGRQEEDGEEEVAQMVHTELLLEPISRHLVLRYV